MNVTNLLLDTDFLCGSTSASYATADKLRNFNVYYNDISRIIWESQGSWQYDDANSTSIAIATSTLVDSQQDYSLPPTSQRIQRIEILDGSGAYQKLKQIDWADITIATSQFYKGVGTPVYYDLVGNSVFLYPTPGTGYVTMANGIKVYFDRNVTEMTAVSATPGFALQFHRILSLGASLDFVQEQNQRNFLIGQKQRLEAGLVRFYGKRNLEGKTTIKPAGAKRWRQYT